MVLLVQFDKEIIKSVDEKKEVIDEERKISEKSRVGRLLRNYLIFAEMFKKGTHETFL
jgi:hypothetical protein